MQTNTIATEDKQLIEEISALKPLKKIENDKQQQMGADLLAVVKTNAKALDARKKAITQPLNAALKEVRAQFKPAEDQLAQIESTVKTLLLDYHERQEAAAQAEIDRIENDKRYTTKTAMAKLANIDTPDTDLGGAQIKYGPMKVRITDPAKLPTKYFHDPDVMEALRKAVAKDIRDHNAPVPTGAETYREKVVAGIAG